MKKILLSLVLVVSILSLSSCNRGKVYEQRHNFDSYSWERLTDNKTITFSDIDIQDTTSVYDIYVTVRHTPYINEKEIKLLMKIITPDGVIRQSSRSNTIKLKDRYGKEWVGDAMGDLIDVEEKCRSLVEFPVKGKYTITLTNMGKYPQITGIMDIGIKVVKSDLDDYKNAK